MAYILSFVNKTFVEGKNSESKATLEIIPDGKGGKATLTFSDDASLIERRTASRQAESICRSGFLLASGERIGIGTKLEVIDADKLSDAHLREGYKYNRV